MTPESREAAFAEIMEKCYVGVSIIDHVVIDDVNIFQASMRAMAEAVKRLAVAPDCVLVDGNRTPKGLPYQQFPIVDGDALSFTIACASVIAKVTRDRIMEEYHETYPDYGFKRHKGYCTREHVDALKTKGPCEIHRRSFEPVKSLALGKKIDLSSIDVVEDVY